jgi:sec-independent protein translocase protein TatA
VTSDGEGEAIMFGLTIWHWVLFFVVVILLFGGARVSGLTEQIGRGFAALKRGMDEMRKPHEDK